MIGRTLHNRYEISELLGEGSTATVYKARDKRLNRDVALKVLLPHVRDTVRKRFFQEATSVAQLNHPHIMAIYDIDEDDSMNFLVVEYVEGDSLSDYVPAPPEKVVDIGRQIAMALNYAHQHEIIHRDIKPANIKVTSSGLVKIMDLGLALPRDAKRVTTDGMIIGTPAYLSPEQAQGLTLDFRTDIYSLGIVLYEMLTGQLPFLSDDIPALLMQHVKQAPPPPRLFVPDLPVGLENVILKTLEKNPAHRFQSGEALALALTAAVRGETAADVPTRASHAVHVEQTERAPLRIMLADDHAVLRKTLVNFLSLRDEFIVVGEAGDGQAALDLALQIQPDVLLLDLNMPIKGGLDILPDIRQQAPNIKVLVLTGRDEDWYITQALRAGAHGYLLKASSESDLIDGIIKVMQGHLVLGQGVAEKVVSGMLKQPDDPRKLNDMERQILLLIAGGYDNEQISERLNLDMPELIEVLARAMDKMKAKDRHAAALQALRNGDILLDELQTLSQSGS
jgi:DNA-binding NarL/FixJ family response regulator/tRNA A-37 threonylcarbamoyl transferase component Bud32